MIPALVAIPVAGWTAWRAPRPFAQVFRTRPAWRDACVTLAVGAMLGYVFNDTPGTASVAFIYLAIALLFPPLAVRERA